MSQWATKPDLEKPSGMSRNRQDGKNSSVEFSSLPNDIVQIIADFLPNEDVKRLRLVDRRFHANSILRFPRVYISPNHRNIEVLKAVATHDQFRRQVKEVVWDDALLLDWVAILEDDENDVLDMREWEDACDTSFGDWKSNLDADSRYQTYRQLYAEQQAIIAAGADAEALRDALPLFDALERMTVTPTAWRPDLSRPRYRTPMMRDFPPEFRCPIPVGWMRSEDELERQFEEDSVWQDIKDPWHGFRVVLKELARCERAISEFVCEVKGESTGIAWQLFDESPENCEDLRNLEIICGRGLCRLELVVHVMFAQYMPGLDALSRSRLRSILEKATEMERFSLQTNADDDLGDEYIDDFDRELHALDVIPVTNWPNLRHLTLSHLYVIPEDFLLFLRRLPPTVESITLHSLTAHPDPSWAKIFQAVKDELAWTGSKPVVTFVMDQPGHPTMQHWIEGPILSFLQGEAPNPFNECGIVEGMSTKRFTITPEYMLPEAEEI